MAITRTEYEQLKAKLLRNLSEAEARVEATRSKLVALETLEGELLEEDPAMIVRTFTGSTVVDLRPVPAKSLTMEEIAEIISGAPSTFSHIVIQELAQAKFGKVNPTSVRVGLNRIAMRSNSPIEAKEPGSGQRPTVYKKREVPDIFS